LIIEELGYFDPIFHTKWDVIDSLSIPYATEILKMALASIVDVANYVTVGIKTSDHDGRVEIPKAFALRQNYPNPFNPSTTISFDVAGTDTKQPVTLSIYDVRGRRVRRLINSELDPGSHKIHWDGRNDRGQSVASGIYLYTLKAGEERFTRKMTILK
jgi:flagellar hook assembly protein FlgD